jgi:hypothetical protein
MSDGELEHLMSQLGGQIETIDTHAFMGPKIDVFSPETHYTGDHRVSPGPNQIISPNLPPVTRDDSKNVLKEPKFYPSSIANGSVHVKPINRDDPEESRNKTTPITYDYKPRQKHPSNPYDYPTWQTEWPNGKPRNNHLEIDWNPVDYNYGGYLRPDGPGSRRAQRQPGQYRTHFKNGKQRPRPLANYTNESTHDEKGHIIHKGEIKHGALYPVPGDTHWHGGLVPYNRGPLPADYSHHSHHPGGAPRKPSDYLHKNALYDYVYVPGRKHITTARPQQTHIQNVPRKNTDELNSIRSELKKLTGQNKNLQKMLKEANSKHERHNVRHAEQLDMIRSSAHTPTGIHHSAPTGATGAAGGGRKTKTGFGGVYRVDKSKSQKYPGGGRGGRGGGSGN